MALLGQNISSAQSKTEILYPQFVSWGFDGDILRALALLQNVSIPQSESILPKGLGGECHVTHFQNHNTMKEHERHAMSHVNEF